MKAGRGVTITSSVRFTLADLCGECNEQFKRITALRMTTNEPNAPAFVLCARCRERIEKRSQ